jgi:hypothetical protein
MPDGFPSGGSFKGRAFNLGSTTLAANASLQADLDTAGFSQLLVMARIGNASTPATAAGDLGLFISYYEDDGTTLFPAPLATGFSVTASAQIVSAALSAPVAFTAVRFDLAGVDKVHFQLKNMNGTTAFQGASLSWYLKR